MENLNLESDQSISLSEINRLRQENENLMEENKKLKEEKVALEMLTKLYENFLNTLNKLVK